MPTAAEIIARLELKPHPEGGYYRETFRDSRREVAPGFDVAKFELAAPHWFPGR